MDQHLALLQERGEPRQAMAQVLHPGGGVDQDHAALWRRGIGSRAGSVPPGAAKRLALSRCTRARRASLMMSPV
jgi:hypothetical protein